MFNQRQPGRQEYTSKGLPGWQLSFRGEKLITDHNFQTTYQMMKVVLALANENRAGGVPLDIQDLSGMVGFDAQAGFNLALQKGLVQPFTRYVPSWERTA